MLSNHPKMRRVHGSKCCRFYTRDITDLVITTAVLNTVPWKVLFWRSRRSTSLPSEEIYPEVSTYSSICASHRLT
jgi:hypothetical protein